MIMMKKKVLTTLTIGLTLFSATPVFADEWKQNSTGWWYQNDDGSYPADTWKNISNKWYYFKSDGYMNTGWVKVNGQWYYCEPSGEMRTAELQTDIMTFKFNADGACINFYDNNTPSTQAGWANYDTSSLETWTNNILNENIIYYNGQYWAKPDYVNSLKNENIVYYHDISNEEMINRYRLADIDFDIDTSENKKKESITGLTYDDVNYDVN